MKPFLLFLLSALPVGAEICTFDKDKAGGVPAGWTAGCTDAGHPDWKVEAATNAPSRPNVLKQAGAGTFPWCVRKGVSITDGFVEVKFKALAGSEDQAGGVVWRWQDGDNYYVARANALEDNVSIYYTAHGNRVAFETADVKVTGNEWHTLRVDFSANHFTVSFDGKAVIKADDDTFTKAGAVGVWTKADSVTVFDDFNFGGR